MTKGVLLFANNNEQVDYVKQAIFCAKRVKKYTNLDVTLVTDSSEQLEQYKFYTKYIDKIITVPKAIESQQKKFFDGESYIYATWKNFSRTTCYDITPYDQTLVIDTDFILGSSSILKCFDTPHDFLINRYAFDLIHRDKRQHSRTLSKQYKYSYVLGYCILFYKNRENKNIV